MLINSRYQVLQLNMQELAIIWLFWLPKHMQNVDFSWSYQMSGRGAGGRGRPPLGASRGGRGRASLKATSSSSATVPEATLPAGEKPPLLPEPQEPQGSGICSIAPPPPAQPQAAPAAPGQLQPTVDYQQVFQTMVQLALCNDP